MQVVDKVLKYPFSIYAPSSQICPFLPNMPPPPKYALQEEKNKRKQSHFPNLRLS